MTVASAPQINRRGPVWAYLGLMRPANVMTALADVLAGAFAAGGSERLAWLLLATAALYAGGVALNDVFDASLDRRERPERAIPSGRASLGGAAALGSGLLLLGVAAAGLASWAAMGLACATAAAILAYNGWAKHQGLAGPLVMGLCRGLNLLLGVAALPPMLGQLWPLALLPITYIAAITAISRGEVHGGGAAVGWLAVALAAGVIVAVAALGLSAGNWAALPALALFAWRVMPPFVAAARRPQPGLIGAAVKAGVLSLILLDASLAAAMAGPLEALLIVALWPLSLGLGRVFAVT